MSDAREILRRLDEQDDKLDEIRVEVKATNGRVRSLELWKARWDGARAAVSWVPTLFVALLSGAAAAVLAKLIGA